MLNRFFLVVSIIGLFYWQAANGAERELQLEPCHLRLRLLFEEGINEAQFRFLCPGSHSMEYSYEEGNDCCIIDGGYDSYYCCAWRGSGAGGGGATPTPTPSRTAAPTPSRTTALTPSRTAAITPSRTAAITPSRTAAPSTTSTSTRTATPTPSTTTTRTATPTKTPTTLTATPTPTTTNTLTATPTPSSTNTLTATPSTSQSPTSSTTTTRTITPSPTSTTTLTATPSNTGTPSSTGTNTPSNSSTPTSSTTSTGTASGTSRPTPSNTSTVSPSATSAPVTCGSTCVYPHHWISYPQVPSNWRELVDSASRAYLSERGSLLPSDAVVLPGSSPLSVGAKQLLLSEVLRPGAFRLRFPAAPSVGESVHVSCRAAPPPWLSHLHAVPPLRLCVLSEASALSNGRECASSFPYTLTSASPSDVYVGVNVHSPSIRSYTQHTRDALADIWEYSVEQREQLHGLTLPLPLDFRIECSAQSLFVRVGNEAVSPKYPLQFDFAAIPVVYLPASIPAVSDILVEQEAGVLRSSQSRARLNITDLLHAHRCSKDEWVMKREECEGALLSTNDKLYTRPEFLSQIRTKWNQTGHFALTLTGLNNILLVADTSLYRTEPTPVGLRRQLYVSDSNVFGNLGSGAGMLEQLKYFTANTTVTVRDMPCNVNWVSADGTVMSVTTPSFPELCASKECTSLPISVSNFGFSVHAEEKKVQMRPVLRALQELSEQTVAREYFLDSSALNTHASLASHGLKLLPASLLCPPACPQDWSVSLHVDGSAVASGSVELSPVLTYGMSIPLAREALGSASGREFTAYALSTRVASSLGHDGMHYVSECFGDYTNVTSGACEDPSNPLSYQCSWGQHNYCRRCPEGALCPGSFRIWPRKGYWVSHESSLEGVAHPCPNPDATTRCPGWPLECDPEQPECAYLHEQYVMHGAFPCGRGYRTGSRNCAQCDRGYYPSAQGTCNACPPGTAWATVLLPILYLFGGLLLLTFVLFTAIYGITKCFGGDLSKSASKAVHFLLWSWISLQTVVQATRSLGPGAPEWLYFFYSGLSALQFEGIVAHPNCLNSIPFQTEWSKYGSIVVLYAILIVYCVMSKDAIPKGALAKESNCAAAVAGVQHIHDAIPEHTSNSNGADGVRASRLSHYWQLLKSKCIPTVLTLLLLLYATVSNSALEVVSCKTNVMTVRAYVALDSNGHTARSQHDFSPDTWERILAYVHKGVLQPSFILNKLDLPLQVSTMRTDANRVCYEGTHLPVAMVSWLVLLVYSIGHPLLSFYLVRKYAIAHLSWHLKRDEMDHLQQKWLGFLSFSNLRLWWQNCRCRRGNADDGAVDKHCSATVANAKVSAVQFHNPMHQIGGKSVVGSGLDCVSFASTLAQRSDADGGAPSLATEEPAAIPSVPPHPQKSSRATEIIVDQSKQYLKVHPLLKPFMTGAYRPSKYYYVQLEKMVLLILGAATALTYDSTHLPSHVIGLCVALPVTLLSAAMFYKFKPFPKVERWKRFVKVYLYILVSFSLITNFIVYLLHSDSRFDGGEKLRIRSIVFTFLSITCFVVCIGLFLTLTLAFLLTMVRESTRSAARKNYMAKIRKSIVLFRPQSLSFGSSPVGDSESRGKLRKWLDTIMNKFYDNSLDELNDAGRRRSVMLNTLRNSYANNHELSIFPTATQTGKREFKDVFHLESSAAHSFSPEMDKSLAPMRIRSTRIA